MARIAFKNISISAINDFEKLFSFVSQAKAQGTLNNGSLETLLKDRLESKFWWPTIEERDEWLRNWQSTPVEMRHYIPDLVRPWGFESWVEALENAEIQFNTLKLNPDGTGILEFEQLAWPSGGIEAIEQLVNIYDGVIVSNDAT